MTLKEVCGMMICMGQLDDSTKIYVRDTDGNLLVCSQHHENGIKAYLDDEVMEYHVRIGGNMQVYVAHVENVNLNDFSTCELVEELKRREGVNAEYAEPYQDKVVTVNGPAQILVIID